MGVQTVPDIRIERVNEAPVRGGGRYVLYWMIAARRPRHNFGLQRAIEVARDHAAGLVVLEALRCDYRWASDRIHQFVVEGMEANRAAFRNTPIRYYPYVETRKGDGKGLLEALAQQAIAVVTDDFPCFFLPRMVEAAGRKLDVRLERVDSNGLIPLRSPAREFTVAHSFRRWLQKNVAEYLKAAPRQNPLHGAKLPRAEVHEDVIRRWPELGRLDLSTLPIEHSVGPGYWPGGFEACEASRLPWFDRGYGMYGELRNHPDEDNTSNLSPWLHFGHISVWDVLGWVAERENWKPSKLTGNTDGKRGWWGMGDNGEAFMEELVVWRELGYLWCHRHRHDYDHFDSLPDFARTTLTRHAGDTRPFVYSLEEFETAQTHDEVWNAAQRQLVREGRMHNYLRMLWGKKILHWTESPKQALEFMIHLNNRYALDGRNPNSYSGITWCLGRFDRAWGPERAVFGKVRYMTSASTRRKCRMEEYLQRFAD